MISYCGLPCYECGALLATKTDDDDKRREVAELWSKQYSADIKPQDINCDGCLSEGGRLFGHCKVCEIRKCCSEKAIDNCAYCGEYACDKLGSFFQMSPESKKRLDEIHSKL
ncbi:MAG: DUF3795 domain-containing protein [Candidatus Krumholzibacteria bacterium]|nr:DUF3795 domain-containing protein [Candidatus Krumholzibacteria bacterium]